MCNKYKAEADRIRAIKPSIDSAYKIAEGVRLPIKMYIPEEGENKNTLIVAIHGGSWFAVKENSDSWDGSWMNYQAQYYFDKGYTTAAFSYRSVDISEETTVFDLISDCKDALRYIGEKTDFDRLIVMGDSAGGHLTVELALDDEIDIRLAVALNPVLDLTEESWKHTAKTHEDRIKASPIHNMKKTDTKFLVMHGNADECVNCKTSERFCEEMSKLGVQADYIELDGVKHAFIISRYESSDEEVSRYMSMIDKYMAENM